MVFGVIMSMFIGGIGFMCFFLHPVGFLFSMYALPFILFYGIPVASIARKLTAEKNRPSTKRLVMYLIMGGWLPANFFSTIYLTQDVYYNVLAVDVGFIVISLVFSFGFWLGEELFERTKLKSWTDPDLSRT